MSTKDKAKVFVVLGILCSLVSAPIFAADVDTNGLETLRKTGKAFTAVAKDATPGVVAVQAGRHYLEVRDGAGTRL